MSRRFSSGAIDRSVNRTSLVRWSEGRLEGELGETESRRQLAQRLDALRDLRAAALAVQQHRSHPERASTLDVVLDGIADHRRLARLDCEPVEDGEEDARVGLRL